jgi:aminoglycoside phosphotransferase family enzyme
LTQVKPAPAGAGLCFSNRQRGRLQGSVDRIVPQQRAMECPPDLSGPDYPDPGIAAKVEFLRRPAAYAEAPAQVEVVETHMSWVFLTDRFAYKLKKPLRYEFLDFRELAARRRNCEAEIRLNRRLAPTVYLGLLPLTFSGREGLRLEGTGAVVDWLVKMRRLPREAMLDRAIAEGEIPHAGLRNVGLLLAGFYRDAAPVAMAATAYCRRFAAGVADNRHHLQEPAYDLPMTLVDRVCDQQARFVASRSQLLGGRAEDRHIVEAHGDLRPEHICLEDPPEIIDCLEFNRDLRLLDPADELAFLALECERLGAAPLGPLVFAVYHEVTGDCPTAELVAFYKSYRACVRAKIAAWHLRDRDVREPAKWPALARVYLGLAESYAARLD